MRKAERLKEQGLSQEKKVRADYVKLVRAIRSDITDSGLNSVRYKLEYYKQSPINTMKGYPTGEVIRAYEEAIDQYLSLLRKRKENEKKT